MRAVRSEIATVFFKSLEKLARPRGLEPATPAFGVLNLNHVYVGRDRRQKMSVPFL